MKKPISERDMTTPPPKTSKRNDSITEILLMEHLNELGIIRYEREYRFHSERKWRFDFAFWKRSKDSPIAYAIEIEGGIWTNGAHVRGKHFESDLHKYNEAAKLGWTVIRFTPAMIERAEDKEFLAELFGRKP